MLYSSLAILFAVASAGAGEMENRPTAIVKFPNEETTVAVFWEDRQKQAGKDWCRVEYDEPWLSQPRYWKGPESNVVVEGRERPSDREKRIRAGWEQVGFVEVGGQRVSAAEAQLADRAREMAGLNQEAPPAAAPAAVETPAQDASAPPPPPSFIGLWGAHIAVLVCAAILLAVAVKAFFLAPGKGG